MLPLKNIQIWPTDLLVLLQSLKATVVTVSLFHFWKPAHQCATGIQTLPRHFDVGSCCWLLVLWAVLWGLKTHQSPLSKHSCEFACDNVSSFGVILLSCASCLGSNLSSCALISSNSACLYRERRVWCDRFVCSYSVGKLKTEDILCEIIIPGLAAELLIWICLLQGKGWNWGEPWNICLILTNCLSELCKT